MSVVSVAVLLVLYNDKNRLVKLLKSLSKQSYKEFTIYVIDNYPEKESISKVMECFPDAIILKSQGNIGFGSGNNILADKAIKDGCSYLFILNPDMELSDNTIEILVNKCESNKNIGIASCVVLFGRIETENEKIQLFGGKLNFKTQKKEFLFTNTSLKNLELPISLNVDFVNGGSTFIRSEMVNKIGLFEEKYFMYNEEIDLSNRVKKAGYKIIVTSETKIWHHHDWGCNNSIGYKLMYYYIMRNRYIYYKNFNLYFNLLVDLVLQSISLPIKLKWFYKLSSISITKYYYLGILRGIMGETGKTKEIFK